MDTIEGATLQPPDALKPPAQHCEAHLRGLIEPALAGLVHVAEGFSPTANDVDVALTPHPIGTVPSTPVVYFAGGIPPRNEVYPPRTHDANEHITGSSTH